MIVLVCFPAVALGLRTFIYRDAGFYSFPVAAYHRICFWNGEIPLWNPYNDFGLPFLAQWNTMVLYPPTLIYLLLPLTFGFGWFYLLHFLWGMVGAYRLARRWTQSDLAAAAAGIGFGMNGLTLNCLQWTNYTATIAWLPWVVLTMDRAASAGGRAVLFAALAAALQFLSGGPEVIVVTWLITAITVGIGSLRAADRNRRLRNLAMCAILLAGLVAAQVLPLVDLLVRSHRDRSFDSGAWAMPIWGWANFLVPKFRYHEWEGPVGFQAEQYWTSSYYSGIVLLALAAAAVAKVRTPKALGLFLLAALGLLLAFGNSGWIYPALRKVIPALGFVRYPVKYVCLTAFTLPFLAAFGLAHLDRAPSSQRAPLQRLLLVTFVIGILAIASIVLWAAGDPQTRQLPGSWHRTWVSGVTRGALLMAATTLLIVMLRGSSIWRQWIGCAVLALVFLDLRTHVPWQNPTGSPSDYALNAVRESVAPATLPTLGESRLMISPKASGELYDLVLPDPERNFLVHRAGLFSDCNLLDLVPKADGFFPLYLRNERFVRVLLYSTEPPSAPLADFLSISTITEPGTRSRWIRRPDFLPVATSGQRPVFASDAAVKTELAAGQFHPRTEVFLAPETRNRIIVTNSTKASVRVARWEPHHVTLRVSAREPTLVVLSQTDYHPWRASLDGKPQPIFRANLAFQALQVPGGEHQVELRYIDWPFRIGAAISVFTFLLMLLAAIRPGSFNHRASTCIHRDASEAAGI